MAMESKERYRLAFETETIDICSWLNYTVRAFFSWLVNSDNVANDIYQLIGERVFVLAVLYRESTLDFLSYDAVRKIIGVVLKDYLGGEPSFLHQLVKILPHKQGHRLLQTMSAPIWFNIDNQQIMCESRDQAEAIRDFLQAHDFEGTSLTEYKEDPLVFYGVYPE